MPSDIARYYADDTDLQIKLHFVSNNIPNIFDYNLETNYQILILFSTDISDTTCHQIGLTVQSSTSPNVCFCTI